MVDCVSYLRVSSKGQIDGDGFDRQRETISQYAKANKLNILDEYREEGVSGTKELDNRIALAELLDRVQTNGVKMVLVEKADRLARDLLIGEVILQEFRAAGVQVISCDNGTDLTAGDSNDPTSKLIRQVLGAVAEFEKDVLVLKLRAARNRKRIRTGKKVEGRKAFGEVSPAEIQTLARIKQLVRKPRNSKPLSYRKIANILNDEGHTTRTGKQWRDSTIYKIVKSNKWTKADSYKGQRLTLACPT
jgi:DNA invertase Pin-like site-specific DNA recombinase